MKYLLLCLSLLFLTLPAVSQERPIITPDQPTMGLDDLGNYEAGYALRGGPNVSLPVGWTSGLDSPTGAACQSAGRQNGREAWLLHCPWRGKTGVTFQEFTFRLPHVPRIILRGATALRADAVGKSDGVTFRVFVNGEKGLDVNRTDSLWQPFDSDLTAEAGKMVTLRFETDPGPNDNSSFDFALWGDRQLVLTGFAPTAKHRPTPLPLPLSRLTSSQNGSVVPLSGFVGKTTVRVTANSAILRYAGLDGTLEYVWKPSGESDSLLGSLTLRAKMTRDTPVEAPLAGQSRLNWTSQTALKTMRLMPNGDGTSATLTRTYSVGGQTATVTVTGRMEGKSLVFDVHCDKPVLRWIEGSDWGPTLRRKQIPVPYYSNPIWYLAQENLFAASLLDWTVSQASSQDRTRANYDALTDGTRNLLKERLIYTAAWQLAETLPNIPNAPSPFRADLSSRVMLDIWGGDFSRVQARLHTLAENGFGPAAAILHVWQHDGYDNGLPSHVPANADQGGDAALKELVQSSQADNIKMALHENYVDYYPNFAGFTDMDIARASDGSRVNAWYNSGTKIQSFAVKPTRILPLAKTQGLEVLKRYGSAACYLDVHSAVPPWFHVDLEARQNGAGKFAAVRDAHRALWAYERDLHHGPVFGEGANHWYWSGDLDGVEAQFGQGWPDGQGTSAPLMVDFDLLKIHPLQFNHGMGYYERWWASGPNAERSLMSLLDQYRMQEAAFGHQGFLGGEAWHDGGLSLLEAHLLRPLTKKTALANPIAIDYWGGGKWVNTSEAAKTGDWLRVRVRYDNGVTVWANSSKTPLTADGLTLPRYGWHASGPGLSVGTTERSGVVSDFSETPDSVFANARPAADWAAPGQTRLRPTVAEFTPIGPRTFRATYKWGVGQTLLEDYHCFVHFVQPTLADGGENIRFQQDHALPSPTSTWKPGETVTDGPYTITVPAEAPPGDYPWTVGFYGSSGRLTMQGQPDTHSRIILGILHVKAEDSLSFSPTPLDTEDKQTPINHDNRVLDFGPIRTNGSVFIQREGKDWILHPYPHDRPFTIKLSAAKFGHPAKASVVNGWWTLPLTGVAAYRWEAKR